MSEINRSLSKIFTMYRLTATKGTIFAMLYALLIMASLVAATSTTKRPERPSLGSKTNSLLPETAPSLNHNHQRHHHHQHSRQPHHQPGKSSRIKKSGGNHSAGHRMLGDDFAGAFHSFRERKPNIILILTDDQDVELGN